MKTYKVSRVEEAKNKDEAIDKMHYENWDDAEVLSSEIEEVIEIE
jgi:hypothetical protein